jgi:hypothetical protein
VTSLEEIAGFGTAPEEAWERLGVLGKPRALRGELASVSLVTLA